MKKPDMPDMLDLLSNQTTQEIISDQSVEQAAGGRADAADVSCGFPGKHTDLFSYAEGTSWEVDMVIHLQPPGRFCSSPPRDSDESSSRSGVF